MEINFLFQGELVYTLEIPDNAKKVIFELNEQNSQPYTDILVNIPTIKEIEFNYD